MEGYFSIAQIASKVRRSKQAIYKLISNNQELGKILPDNTITIGKGKQYSKAVLDWITEYYERIADSEGESQEAEEEARAGADHVEMALLRQEVEHLKEKLAMTEKMLEDVREEKRDLHKQNNGLVVLLAQEKKEKQLLLQAHEEREKQTISFDGAEIREAEVQEQQTEEETLEQSKPQEEKPGEEKPSFFARLFGRMKKGSAEK